MKMVMLWDGCFPKWHFLDLVFGTPDGKLNYQTKESITYYASMFHDVIYQFKREEGMDFIMDYRLIYCLTNGLPLDMDVYDAAE